MFPTSGYFKGLNCPYFQSGLCERPYCHFRHVKNGKDTNVSNSNPISAACNNGRRPSVPTDSAPVSTPVGPTGSKVFSSERKNIYTSEHSLENNGKTCDLPSLPTVISSNMEPTYDPTPKSLVGTIKSSVHHEEYDPVVSSNYNSDNMPTYLPGSLSDKANTTSNIRERTEKPLYVPESIPAYVPGSVPEYNPTPINKLKKVKTVHGTDLEYDPVSNFAYSSNSANNDITEVQYIPLKRPRFDDFPSPDDDAMSVDGFGDSDSAKFSDSDAVSEKNEVVDSEPVIENDSESTKADLYTVRSCYKDTLIDENKKKSSERSKSLVENDKQVSQKTHTSHSNSITKSSKKDKVEKVVKNKAKGSIEKVHSVSGKDSPGKGHASSSKQEADKKAKHKFSSNVDGKDSKKDKEKSLKKEISSESSHLKSASAGSPANCSSKSSSSKSASKHSSSSSSSAAKSSSAKSSSSSTKSSSKNYSSSLQTSKHTSSSSSKASNKDTSLKSSDKQTNSIQSKDKNPVKKLDSVSVTSSQDGKRSLSKHHSKSEKENVKNSKSGIEKANAHDNKNKVSSKTQPKSENAQNPKVVTKTLCVDLFGQDSDYSDLSDLDEDSSNKTQDMTEEQLQQFLDDSDFECDGDTYDECLRIFNEGIAQSSQSHNTERKKNQDLSSSNSVPAIQMKKRVAHHGADKAGERRFVEKVRTKMSPGEVMHNRIVAMQKKAMEAEMLKKAESDAISNAISANAALFKNGKNRLAHKTKVFDKLSREKEDGRTSAITVVKGEKRKAHTPTLSNVKRPTIPAEYGSKVPTNIRQRYLNLIIDECLKLCKSEEEAYNKAQEEEKAVYERATNKNIYLRVAANAIVRLRRDVQNRDGSPTKTVSCGKQSHTAMLDGRKAMTTSFTVNRSGKPLSLKTVEFKGAELYKRLQPYILTEQQLKENGFPLPNPDAGGCAVFYTENQKKDVSLKQHERNCTRCGKRFIVFPNGKYNSNEECIYHWGKAWKKKVAGSWDTRYTCCGGDLDSEGCSICKLHVHEDNKTSNLSGYMKTIPSSPPIDGDYGVYAMDCEMVYTNIGLELARVTVVDADLKLVYETHVKPDYPVIDYNTRFSGVTEDDIKGVQTTLRDVQAVLLSLFTDKTILMGHSLESDLVAVKLLHKVVVDTSVVFPHRLGPPYKRALRNLMADHLQKIIQNDIGGHDSKEDAQACMELMHWKLKEDAKKEFRQS